MRDDQIVLKQGVTCQELRIFHQASIEPLVLFKDTSQCRTGLFSVMAFVIASGHHEHPNRLDRRLIPASAAKREPAAVNVAHKVLLRVA